MHRTYSAVTVKMESSYAPRLFSLKMSCLILEVLSSMPSYDNGMMQSFKF